MRLRFAIFAASLVWLSGAAFASDTSTKTYHFSAKDRGAGQWDCCSAWLYYSDLDPKGMELGNLTLGIEKKSFFHFAKNGESFTSLTTSISAKSEGYLNIYYVFDCDEQKNPECPLGHVTVPFEMEVSCGEKATADYEHAYSWPDLGVKLARMITSRPDRQKPLTGKAVVVLTDAQPCTDDK